MTLKDKIIAAVILIVAIIILILLAEEKPHIITIEGKQYVRMKEWSGGRMQLIIVPYDSVKQITNPSHIHGEDSTGNYIEIDRVKVYGMVDSCNDSGCSQ